MVEAVLPAADNLQYETIQSREGVVPLTLGKSSYSIARWL